MLTDTVSRFSFPPDVVDACNAVGMSDVDVWRDVCTVYLAGPGLHATAAATVLDRCLDGAADDAATAWKAYVDAVAVYVATDRVILRPLADLARADRSETWIVDVVDANGRPVWEIPPWCEGVDTIGRAADTARHDAGAMALPCCFYGPAVATMSRHGDDVLEYINESGCVDALTLNPATQDWYGFASHVLTVAVELWCGQFPDLDTADLYVVTRKAGV